MMAGVATGGLILGKLTHHWNDPLKNCSSCFCLLDGEHHCGRPLCPGSAVTFICLEPGSSNVYPDSHYVVSPWIVAFLKTHRAIESPWAQPGEDTSRTGQVLINILYSQQWSMQETEWDRFVWIILRLMHCGGAATAPAHVSREQYEWVNRLSWEVEQFKQNHPRPLPNDPNDPCDPPNP